MQRLLKPNANWWCGKRWVYFHLTSTLFMYYMLKSTRSLLQFLPLRDFCFFTNQNFLQMILLIWDLWDEDSLMGLFILHPFVLLPIKRNLPKPGRLYSLSFKQLNVSEMWILCSTVKDLFFYIICKIQHSIKFVVIYYLLKYICIYFFLHELTLRSDENFPIMKKFLFGKV